MVLRLEGLFGGSPKKAMTYHLIVDDGMKYFQKQGGEDESLYFI